jgi:hypothetical protein
MSNARCEPAGDHTTAQSSASLTQNAAHVSTDEIDDTAGRNVPDLESGVKILIVPRSQD